MKLNDATVLVVDDEPILCDIFSQWIKAVGCGTVLTATNGESALGILCATQVHLLISDIRMPRMDGVTLVRRLAQLLRPVPSVIFVSGFGEIDHREMYGLGVEAFLTKPSMREDLLAVMQRALADRSALWRTPMRVAPRQSVLFEIESRETKDGCLFRLGRGGFCTQYGGPLSTGKVSFCVKLLAEERELSGQGLVRWRSCADLMAGIELVYLEDPCRDWILDEIAATSPLSYIPSK
jgi:CheY-like chemotaxis protein